VLEQIIAKLPQNQQEAWVKLLIDSLAAAAEAEKPDGRHLHRLKQFKDAFAKPGTNQVIGAYAAFRYVTAENTVALKTADPGKFDSVQERFRTNLEAFVKAFPNSDDAPEATLRLAMAYEQLKDGEAKAKVWYQQLAQKYSRHPHAAKGAGAVKRLEGEGKPLEVSGPGLDDGKPFASASLKDKVVVVYYCASWGTTLQDDTRKLKALDKEYGPKGLEIVTVWLDHDAKTAAQAKAAHAIPGTHLFAPGGLDSSPLAAQYGIVVVPHLFVAGKDGKIVNRAAQAVTLEDDVKKLLP
jgi:hypothetical protein